MKKLFPGTIFVAALLLLLSIGGRAAIADEKTNSIQGIVVPDSVYDQQPFSFAVGESVPGAKVTLQTVEGLVVQQTSSDKYGRVFLAAGLPAGAYLISLGSHAQPIGKVEIQRRAGDALPYASRPMQLQNPPQTLKLSDPFSLKGHGFSPNCADMQVSLTGSSKTEAPVVLAATEDQLKLAPVQQLPPGAAQLRVTNQAEGKSTDPYSVLLYDIHGTLEQRTMQSGAQTQLVVRTQPETMPLKVKANVASGPVDFGGGRKEVEAITSNGQAMFPVHAERGSGPFQLTWALAELQPVRVRIANGNAPIATTITLPGDLFPEDYISSPRFTAYENLLNAKRDWLNRKILKHQRAIDEEQRMLNAPGNESNSATIQARMDANTAEVNAAKDELKTLDGNDPKAKKVLVKKNVENWIRELEARIRELDKTAEEEKRLAKDANNKTDREKHEANAKDATEEEKNDAKTATDLRGDLEKSGL